MRSLRIREAHWDLDEPLYSVLDDEDIPLFTVIKSEMFSVWVFFCKSEPCLVYDQDVIESADTFYFSLINSTRLGEYSIPVKFRENAHLTEAENLKVLRERTIEELFE